MVVLKTVSQTLLPQQESETMGASKDQAVPHGTVLLFGQMSVGGMVSTTVTVRVQMLL